MEQKRIRWSEQCGDPGCRVFFIGDRVFRAYNESRRQETLDFLNSDCYAELLRRQMVVNTWIVDDIAIDGYSLIVEHEHLTFMPEEWFCFDMLKDMLAFHFEINAICREYGYGIRDIGYGNVTFKHGKLCFTDFGSFRKIENIGNGYLQHGLPLAFLPISIYSKNDSNDFIAHSLITKYHAWCVSYCLPKKEGFLHDSLWKYLHPIVSYYEIFWRNAYPHLRVRKQITLKIIQIINSVIKSFLPRKSSKWSFIKVQNVYSEEKAAKVLKNIEFPLIGAFILPMCAKGSLRYVPDIVMKYSHEYDNKVVLWGNFLYDELVDLNNSIDSEIIVMSNDTIYTNGLYQKLKQNNLPIWVVCCNVMRGNDFRSLNALKCKLLVMQDGVFEQARATDHSDWAEKASHFASYLLVHDLCEEEKEMAKIDNFWSPIEENQEYILYKNRMK